MKNVLSLITCKANGLRYVGVTANGNGGRHPLKYGHGPKFRMAVNEFGPENFVVEILAYGFVTRTDLHEAEREAIVKYGTLWPNGYNRVSGHGGKTCGATLEVVQARNARPEYASKGY